MVRVRGADPDACGSGIASAVHLRGNRNGVLRLGRRGGSGGGVVSAPCPPAYHSAATLARWAIWRAAHPAWKAAVVALGCGAAVVGGVRALPAAPAALTSAPAPSQVHSAPFLAGPLDTALLPPGVALYTALPPLGSLLTGVTVEGVSAPQATQLPPLEAATPFAPPGPPVIVTRAPVIVPLYPPGTPGQPVPEPPAVLLLAAALLVLAVVRWRQ